MSDKPLDSLFPDLRERVAGGTRSDARPVHGRILEQPLTQGATMVAESTGATLAPVAFVIVVWRDPGGKVALHNALRSAIESTLLGELSRTPAELTEEEGRRPAMLRVVLFDAVEGSEEALRAFGLRRVSGELEGLAHIRGEASREGFEVDEPTEVFEAPFAFTTDAHLLDEALRSRLGDRVFGSEPGALFAALNHVLAAMSLPTLAPVGDALDALEGLAIADVEEQIRWVPPTLFQALCDAVGVCAVKERNRTVQWAPSEPDEDGFAPAPMVRLREGAAWAHVPLGRDLMRWLVMPRAKGEAIPPLSQWFQDRFRL